VNTCLCCGTSFEPSRYKPHQKFCSAKCADKAEYRRHHPIVKHKSKADGVHAKDLPKALLLQLYVEENKTQMEIAALLGCSLSPVQGALKFHGIPSRAQKIRTPLRGPESPYWHHASASYRTLHEHVSIVRGRPKLCEQCGEARPHIRYEWASKTKNYADVYDYIRLCRRCHYHFDGGSLNAVNQLRIDAKRAGAK
jgi:hypothetical protein